MGMNRLTAVALLTLLTPAVMTQTAKPQHREPEAPRFVGAWRVLSVTDTRADGTEVADLYLGPHPVGFLIYEATGHMCFGAMNPDRPPWADASSGTPAELATAAEGNDAYCGTYDVDEERKTVAHHLRVALVPNDVGTSLVRTYVMSGNRLRLSGTNGLKPGLKIWTVTLERATPAR